MEVPGGVSVDASAVGGPEATLDREAVDVVVPLKRLDRAKTRLAAASSGLPAALAGPPAHEALVLALLRDTLAAARAARRVRRVVVVTAARPGDLGVPQRGEPEPEIVPDPGCGLNAALRAGAAHLRTTAPWREDDRGVPRRRLAAVAALQADLPALRGEELDAALSAALAVLGEAHPTSPVASLARPASSPVASLARPGAGAAPTAAYVADRHGSGTTLLVTAAGRVPRPRFGRGSAAAHRAAGAVALDGTWPGLRTDVDTPADLADALALGCGPATLAWPGPRVPASPCGS